MAGMLDGKVVLVTGAARGIGRGSAQLFAREGALVAVADISADGVEETAELIVKTGGRAIAVGADVSKAAEVSTMMEPSLRRMEGSTARSTMRASTGVWPASVASLRQSGRKRPSTGYFRLTSKALGCA